jgi:biotin/methionine sulfoxide reductase
MAIKQEFSTGGHWGVFKVAVDEDGGLEAKPFPSDPDPTPLIGSALAANSESRIQTPMVRKGWLDNGPTGTGAGRGAEPFVPVSWDVATELVAAELRRISEAHGPSAIYGGSYGWASAGRLHAAPGTLKRFLGLAGGFTNSVGNYSNGAASVLLPHILGSAQAVNGPLTSWGAIAEHTDTLLCFGGVPLKNTQINHGGLPEHDDRLWQKRLSESGIDVVYVGPLKDDVAEFVDAEWLAIRPNTDTAMMLGLAHTMVAEGLEDKAFLNRYCTGFDKFRAYLLGDADGTQKDADWAAAICEIDGDTIRALARRLAAGRSMITACWSLQRADHGEQPYWAAVTLAAMLGQIGLPGGGVGFGYGCLGGIGTPRARAQGIRLPVGSNPCSDYIPVARVTDMLLNPGGQFDFNGKNFTYPDVHAIYWCGGNPFHHHQDLNRLLEGWRRVDTVIVHEPWWTSAARHADIVLPSTTTLERNDIGVASVPAMMFAMEKAIDPPGEARNDFDIFADIAGHMGIREEYTEGRDEMGWLRHLYDIARQQNAEAKIELPGFDEFWEQGYFEYPRPDKPVVLMQSFRDDPDGRPLKTPSGKIEIFSDTIAGFGYDDCPGHATWMEPVEWLGGEAASKFPLHMISNQPRTRLHGQLDSGPVSRDSKIEGREPVWMNPEDASQRGLVDGDIVRLFNERGACLAGLVVTSQIRAGVVQLATGAWYDPLEPGVAGTLDRHGNPNILTLDKGTSKLAQAPISQTALVEVEKFDGVLPEITIYSQPETV